jgi:uncharacterized membrane protein
MGAGPIPAQHLKGSASVGATQRGTYAERMPWWLLIPLIVGGAARFLTLGHQSFWADEGATIAILHHSLGSVFHAVRATESTPPVYYFLAWFWVHVFGFGEAGVRSLSALFGTATIAIVALAARGVGGVRAGAAGAWLVAANPVLFWFSQEARAYSLLALLSALSVACMIRVRSSPSPGRVAAWTVAAIAAACTHYFGGFLVAAELCVLLAWPGERLRRRTLVPSALVLAAASVPLVLLAHAQYGNSGFVRGQGLLRAVAEAAGQLLVGYGVDPVMVVCAALSAVGLVLCVLPFAKRRPIRAELSPVALAVALAVLAPVIVALAGANLIDSRNMLFVLPAVALVAGVGATLARPPWAIALPVIAGMVVIVHVYFDTTLQRTDFRGAAKAIGAAREPRAILVRMSGSVDLNQYLPALEPLRPVGARVDEIVILGLTMSGGLNRDVEPLGSLRFTAPAGFREVAATATSTFTLRRYRASGPVLETATDLERRAGGDVQVLFEGRAG